MNGGWRTYDPDDLPLDHVPDDPDDGPDPWPDCVECGAAGAGDCIGLVFCSWCLAHVRVQVAAAVGAHIEPYT